MMREDLPLSGCCLFTTTNQSDPALGEAFYNYRDYTAMGLKTVFSQHFRMEFARKDILRGFYIQDAPLDHEILMICEHGSFQITLLDVRADSETYLQHISTSLAAEGKKALYFPRGIAYALLSLRDDSSVYCMSDRLITTAMNRTINPFDKKLNCQWPPNIIVSALERTSPTVDELPHNYW